MLILIVLLHTYSPSLTAYNSPTLSILIIWSLLYIPYEITFNIPDSSDDYYLNIGLDFKINAESTISLTSSYWSIFLLLTIHCHCFIAWSIETHHSLIWSDHINNDFLHCLHFRSVCVGYAIVIPRLVINKCIFPNYISP